MRTHAHMHIHTLHRLFRLTSGAHVDEGVVDQNQFIEVELICEPLAFSLMEDPFVIVVSGKEIKKNIRIKYCAHTCRTHEETSQVEKLMGYYLMHSF